MEQFSKEHEERVERVLLTSVLSEAKMLAKDLKNDESPISPKVTFLIEVLTTVTARALVITERIAGGELLDLYEEYFRRQVEQARKDI